MRPHRPHNTHVRDHALRKLTWINRWLIAASVALTGLFAEAAAHAFPGKSAAHTAAAANHANANAHHRHHVSHTSTRTQSLNAPQQPPQATSESSAPAEAAPREQAPTEEAPHESAHAKESAPVEPAPEPEATHEATPAPAGEAPPVVSGGS
jgi:hypothetical protein